MKILIPSCKTVAELATLYEAIADTAPFARIVTSCTKASAAVNRNICLDAVELGETAIFIDDDISGFYEGWTADLLLPLVDPDVVMVSARLMNVDGTPASTCTDNYDLTPDEIEIFSNGTAILPSAAIGFRHTGVRFDENLRGSGFDDSLWCHEILDANPNARFIQSNKCRLIHANEMKHQKGANWRHNYSYFKKKRSLCVKP